MNWNDASKVADNYVITWNRNNSELPVLASRSELLSKEELDELITADRMLGVVYWTATESGSGIHWLVDSDGEWAVSYDSRSYVCCPGVWIGARESSKGISEDKDSITFERLHEICEEGSADLILKPGDKLENGYIVVAIEPDNVKIWSASNNSSPVRWKVARVEAGMYYTFWNSKNVLLPIRAVRGELLSAEEASILPIEDRTIKTGFWTATEYDMTSHWRVDCNGHLNGSDDQDKYGYCPGIWVK